MLEFITSSVGKPTYIRKIFYLVPLLTISSSLVFSSKSKANEPSKCHAAIVPTGGGDKEIAAEGINGKIEHGQEMVSILSRLANESRPDVSATVLTEKHSLYDFLSADPKKNLAVKAPFTVMNAAQRMLAIIYSQGVEKTRAGLTQESFELYPFFSNGLEITNGRRIIGHEAVISTFVHNLQQQAGGDRSAVSIPLLVGSHGTGKSEFLELLALGEQSLTTGVDTPFAYYSFEWKNLEKIPNLLPALNPIDVGGGNLVYQNMKAPLGDSPYTLFPDDVQKLILEEARGVVGEFLRGMEPNPVRKPDPASQHIRNEILAFYTEQRGHSLTPQEIIEVLDQHVVVVRRVERRMPKIDAQPKDIDVSGLFFAVNPVVKYASGFGPSHPLAYYYNGKFLTSHGNVVLMDEVLRNSKEFLDILLSAFESRVLSVGGSPDVPYDSVIIAATNSANLDDVMEKATGHAAVNRFLPLRMPWPVDPMQIASLLLLQKNQNLYQKDLHPEEGQIPTVTRARILDDIYPKRNSGLSFKTSDHRYRLFYGSGPDQVEIAPFSIMLMAEILAASRMETDATAASKLFNGKISGSNLLRSPIDRIRLWEGQLSNTTQSELKELDYVTRLMHEGEKGISSRDAGRWFTLALIAAKAPQNNHTLTPTIIIKTLREMLSESNKGSIVTQNHKERLRWLGLMDEVRDQLLIPRLEADISTSLANGDSIVKAAYYDFVAEMLTLSQDEDARIYISPVTHKEKVIDRERKKRIEEIYRNKNGRHLNSNQIAIFHGQQTIQSNGEGRQPNQGLLEAISDYYAELNSKVAGLSDIVDYDHSGVGNEDVQTAHSTLMEALNRLGYNETAAREALNLIKFVRSQALREKP